MRDVALATSWDRCRFLDIGLFLDLECLNPSLTVRVCKWASDSLLMIVLFKHWAKRQTKPNALLTVRYHAISPSHRNQRDLPAVLTMNLPVSGVFLHLWIMHEDALKVKAFRETVRTASFVTRLSTSIKTASDKNAVWIFQRKAKGAKTSVCFIHASIIPSFIQQHFCRK